MRDLLVYASYRSDIQTFTMFDSKAKASVAKWFGISTKQAEVDQNILKWHRRSMVVHGQIQPPAPPPT